MTYPPVLGAEKAWAPCVHSDEDAKKAAPWMIEVLKSENFLDGDQEETAKDLRSGNGLLEDLLWRVALDGDRFGFFPFKVVWEFHADQWVGVDTTITWADGRQETLWTEGDSFTLAVGKAVERLKAKAEAYFKEHPEEHPVAVLKAEEERLEKEEATSS
jgi:hypothetical protein